jgi:hypothetical protein
VLQIFGCDISSFEYRINELVNVVFECHCLYARESNEVGADTEASTCAGRRADRRSIDIENSESGRGDEGDHGDFTGLEGLARKDERGNCHRETLEKILDDASNEIPHIERRSGRLGLRLHDVY